jgi:hypothetical protein
VRSYSSLPTAILDVEVVGGAYGLVGRSGWVTVIVLVLYEERVTPRWLLYAKKRYQRAPITFKSKTGEVRKRWGEVVVEDKRIRRLAGGHSRAPYRERYADGLLVGRRSP